MTIDEKSKSNQKEGNNKALSSAIGRLRVPHPRREQQPVLGRMSGIQFIGTFTITYVIYGVQPHVGAPANALVAFYGGDLACLIQTVCRVRSRKLDVTFMNSTRCLATTSTALELYGRMLSLHPNRFNPGSLWAVAKAAKPS